MIHNGYGEEYESSVMDCTLDEYIAHQEPLLKPLSRESMALLYHSGAVLSRGYSFNFCVHALGQDKIIRASLSYECDNMNDELAQRFAHSVARVSGDDKMWIFRLQDTDKGMCLFTLCLSPTYESKETAFWKQTLHIRTRKRIIDEVLANLYAIVDI